MTIEVDHQEAEVIDHMRHVTPIGRDQIVWRARVIRTAEERKTRQNEAIRHP